MSQECENCGSRVYDGLCSWCDEEALILRDEEMLAEQDENYQPCTFSKEFVERAKQQEAHAIERKANDAKNN